MICLIKLGWANLMKFGNKKASQTVRTLKIDRGAVAFRIDDRESTPDPPQPETFVSISSRKNLRSSGWLCLSEDSEWGYSGRVDHPLSFATAVWSVESIPKYLENKD